MECGVVFYRKSLPSLPGAFSPCATTSAKAIPEETAPLPSFQSKRELKKKNRFLLFFIPLKF